MKHCPKVGDRVRLPASHRFGALTGTVMAIYPTNNDVFDDDGEFVRFGAARPESEWHVGVKVDVLPANWSYPNTDRFAPEVGELTLIRS